MKALFRLQLPLALLAGSLLLVGCLTRGPVLRTEAPGEVYVQGHMRGGLVIDGLFHADGTLDRSPFLGEYFKGTKVKLTDLRSIPSDTGFLRIQATVENTSRTRERIEFRYRWLDANGMEIAAGSSGWQSETVETKEMRSLEGVARSLDVVSFQLFVRTYQPRK